MAFDALEVAIQLCATLRSPLDKLKQHDPDLAEQARSAMNGVPLQLAEGRRRTGKDRLNRYRIADGSADELHTALRVAMASGYLTEADLRPSLILLDREKAMCWRLTH